MLISKAKQLSLSKCQDDPRLEDRFLLKVVLTQLSPERLEARPHIYAHPSTHPTTRTKLTGTHLVMHHSLCNGTENCKKRKTMSLNLFLNFSHFNLQCRFHGYTFSQGKSGHKQVSGRREWGVGRVNRFRPKIADNCWRGGGGGGLVLRSLVF